MSKVHATYIAPKDDSPVVETRGVRFFDGQAVPLDHEEHGDLIAKLRTNQHFDVDGDDDQLAQADIKPSKADHLAKARAAKAAKQQQNL